MTAVLHSKIISCPNKGKCQDKNCVYNNELINKYNQEILDLQSYCKNKISEDGTINKEHICLIKPLYKANKEPAGGYCIVKNHNKNIEELKVKPLLSMKNLFTRLEAKVREDIIKSSLDSIKKTYLG